MIDKKKINNFEMFLIALFLLLLFFSIGFQMNLLENLLLFIGFSVGLISLIFVVRLGRNYPENKKEITVWTIRFFVFKFFPFAIYFIKW